jgi:hypothetical protein
MQPGRGGRLGLVGAASATGTVSRAPELLELLDFPFVPVRESELTDEKQVARVPKDLRFP